MLDELHLADPHQYSTRSLIFLIWYIFFLRRISCRLLPSYSLLGDYKEDVTSQRTFAEEFARLLKSLWAHQTPHMTGMAFSLGEVPCCSLLPHPYLPADLAPIDLLQAFRALVPSLSQHMRQQDAHEGLTYMLDLIHDSINKSAVPSVIYSCILCDDPLFKCRAKSKTYHEEGSQSSSQALLDRKVSTCLLLT